MARHNVYRDGKLYVMEEKCATCIFRPGNLMQLQRGRVKSMLEEVERDDGCIPCHSTLYGKGDNAICRGQYDSHPTPTIKLAEQLGIIEWQKEEKS